MKRASAIAAPLLLLALTACGSRPPDYAACLSAAQNPDQRIAACTQVIASGQLSKLDLANALHARGKAWAGKGDHARARADYDEALRANPIYMTAIYDRFMAEPGKPETKVAPTVPKAAPQKPASKPVAAPPAGKSNDPAEYVKRGLAWAEKDDYDRAINEYNEALRIAPNHAAAHARRASAWQRKGDYARAIADYTELARIEPKNVSAHNSAAWLLATAPDAKARNGARAVEVARKAAELSAWKDGDILDTLAAAYAEAGNFAEAVRWQEKAMENPEFMKNQAEDARARLALYRKGRPFHQ
jgi:tetratricopeptide (TPR) repeat protein